MEDYKRNLINNQELASMYKQFKDSTSQAIDQVFTGLNKGKGVPLVQ